MSGFSRSALADIARSRLKADLQQATVGCRALASGFSRSALADIVKSRLKADFQQRRGALGAAGFVNENAMNAKAVQAQAFTASDSPSQDCARPFGYTSAGLYTIDTRLGVRENGMVFNSKIRPRSLDDQTL